MLDIAEPVSYWRWIGQNKIAAVGKNAAYHIDITNQEQAVRVFDK